MDKRILITLKDEIVAKFSDENWEELAILCEGGDRIHRHHRLLRSLSWGDSDYAGNVLEVLNALVTSHEGNLSVIQRYISEKWPGEVESHFVSGAPSARKITFAPSVFQLPSTLTVNDDQIAVMMPFRGFDVVYSTIRVASLAHGFMCRRADEVWNASVIMQDIFELILLSKIVVCDLSERNPNVMYEMGIAHTLGKLVVPISQSVDDLPSDMRHHRAIVYQGEGVGLERLKHDLGEKFRQVRQEMTPPF